MQIEEKINHNRRIYTHTIKKAVISCLVEIFMWDLKQSNQTYDAWLSTMKEGSSDYTDRMYFTEPLAIAGEIAGQSVDMTKLTQIAKFTYNSILADAMQGAIDECESLKDKDDEERSNVTAFTGFIN